MTKSRPIYKIATRGSKLALWQAHHVAANLGALGLRTEICVIETEGDRVQSRFLHEIGGKGLFAKEIEMRLLEKKADLAVHCLKDLPVHGPEGLFFAAFLERTHPGDYLITGIEFAEKMGWEDDKSIKATDLHALSSPIRIATGSLRRSHLLKCPQVEVVPIRGNIDSRVRRLKEGEWEALVVAEAGVRRIDADAGLCSFLLERSWFVPSPAQGALVIQMHEDSVDTPLHQAVKGLNHLATQFATKTERLILEKLEADCTTPVGVHLSYKGKELVFDTVVLSRHHTARGSLVVSDAKTTPEAIAALMMDLLYKRGLKAVLEELEEPAEEIEKP